MKQSNVPIYTDPDNFEELGSAAKFPCSTQYMEYKTLVSRYQLTVETLEKYGVIVGCSTAMQFEQFIEGVSEDIYTVMARLAPFNYQYNCWLVAQSRSLQFPSRYACRKQFERALIYQAQYKQRNIDVRDINGIDLDGGKGIYHKELRKEFRHISPKSMDILQSLGLFFNGNIPAKHLIDYVGGM